VVLEEAVGVGAWSDDASATTRRNKKLACLLDAACWGGGELIDG
jgi:hypothetical protein